MSLVEFGPNSGSGRGSRGGYGGQSKEKDQKWPQHFSSFKNGRIFPTEKTNGHYEIPDGSELRKGK